MINGTINEEDLNYEVIYNSNNHPLYKSVNNKNIIKDNEDWDDSEILAIFDQAIKTHRTKVLIYLLSINTILSCKSFIYIYVLFHNSCQLSIIHYTNTFYTSYLYII